VNLVIQGPSLSAEQALEVARLAGSTRAPKIAEHAWRIHGAAPAEAIPAFCERNQIDYAWMPDGRRFADLKLLAMDMDSTLITIECIDELGDLAGKKPEIAAITARAMRGEIDFAESLRKRVSLLQDLPLAALERVYDERLRLTSGAEALLSACKKYGVRVLLVSGGFTFFTERLKARLGLDYTISNTLETRDGRLTGKVLGDIVGAEAKAMKFVSVLKSLGASREQSVAIGDGANDLKMLAEAGLSVAFRAKPVVAAQAHCQVRWSGLDAIPNLFE